MRVAQLEEIQRVNAGGSVLPASTSAAAPAPARRKVLVIDDSSTIRRTAEIFLSQAGCQVLLAEDGFEALAKVGDMHPDLIFCDILMPRLDGYQTCSLIKKSPRFHAIPVIMLSSRDGVFDRSRGRLVGAQDHLAKPFTREALLQAVESCLPRLAPEGALPA
ncbi:response regulator [Cupriavidus sp. IDO]|jgi:twitching motility two-component system response regulator PilG|uniref:response regulator n=1 Tax=Cupriavidus sp. IDO TaxID=1539142 RepID=UPI0005798E3F|nr:response regulator [Cupriavidus sp. IDO]KWR89519.1 two-component system response regulator [Cupriavidus sp. IDO]